MQRDISCGSVDRLMIMIIMVGRSETCTRDCYNIFSPGLII